MDEELKKIMDPKFKLMDEELKKIMDPKELWPRFGKEAKELSDNYDFKSFATLKFRKSIKVTNSKDFIRGLHIGYTIGIVQKVRAREFLDTTFKHMQIIFT